MTSSGLRIEVRRRWFVGLLGVILGCAGSPTSAGDVSSLTIVGAAFAPCGGFTNAARANCAPRPEHGPPDSTVATGDPASLTIGMYALYISPNDDCSSPVLVDDYGATASDKDLVANPVLFTGNPANGSYRCVMLKMSDVIRMKPLTSFGTCVAGTEYAGDIYRDGQTGWKDVDLNPIVGTGTDSLPADDHVTLFMTRDTSAVIARGVSGNQAITLGSDLVVPGTTTFFWNGQGSVVDEGGQCGINPGRPSFQ
ncbi:MAG: hypothetical protein ABI679_00495 [Gemmatimonadota bacterium]